MLIYPLHCRLPPPSFEMWLFSDGQGNFDPLRLLWSETPFNRSSMQEFKLILSLPTTAPLLRFSVEAKALRSCQSCWQPAELKALSNADIQCKWLAANGLHSHFFQCVCVEGDVCLILKDSGSSLFLFKKIIQFANYLVCSCTAQLVSFFPCFVCWVFLFLRQADTPLYVALLLKSLLLWFWMLCS